LNVYLTPATYELGTFEISSLPYRNIIADKKLYVIDFDFYDNQLLAISLNNRRLRESQLILISENGDTAKATNINNPEYLYKDCFGNHHLIEEKTASQIFQDSLRLLLLYPNNKDIFLNSFASIEGYYNGRFLLRIDRFDNQVIDFYLVDENSQAIFKLTTIADEAGLERLSDKGRLQSMEGYSEHDARFEEMCFYNKKPVLSISENGYIFIFNTVENSIEKYDYHGNFYFQKEIDFAQRPGWEETILYDEKNGTYFTAFSKGGITTIYELYIDEGKLGKSMKIPNLQYVQKLKINNGKAYFLYNDPSNYEYKQLFETPLVFR